MPLRSAALLAALVLAACTSHETAPTGAITDDLGVRVATEATPERVIALAPSLTESVAAAAGVSRLAGSAMADDYPAEVETLPRFQSLPLDREAVVALRPDLVLALDGLTPPSETDALRGLGIAAATFRYRTIGDIPRILRTLDTLLATTGGAQAASAFERRAEAVRRGVSGRSPRRVLLLIGADNGTLFAFGADSYASEAVRLSGGENLTDAFPGDAAQPQVEWVLEQAPDVIFVAGDGDVRATLLDAAPALASVPAVQEGRVYPVSPDAILRPGPRTVEALEQMARHLHPEGFAAGAA